MFIKVVDDLITQIQVQSVGDVNIEISQALYDKYTDLIADGKAPKYIDGDVVDGGNITDIEYPGEDYDADDRRTERDALLKETDVWALSDRTMTQAQIDYRQALRDLPSQEGFPNSIEWPTKP